MRCGLIVEYCRKSYSTSGVRYTNGKPVRSATLQILATAICISEDATDERHGSKAQAHSHAAGPAQTSNVSQSVQEFFAPLCSKSLQNSTSCSVQS